jgi:hypothetical protein
VSKKQNGINPDLEKAVSEMLKSSFNDAAMDVELKLKIIDRAINLEKIKQKIQDDAWGSGFMSEDDDK